MCKDILKDLQNFDLSDFEKLIIDLTDDHEPLKVSTAKERRKSMRLLTAPKQPIKYEDYEVAEPKKERRKSSNSVEGKKKLEPVKEVQEKEEVKTKSQNRRKSSKTNVKQEVQADNDPQPASGQRFVDFLFAPIHRIPKPEELFSPLPERKNEKILAERYILDGKREFLIFKD